MNPIWKTENLSEVWKKTLLCLVHKKGDKQECNNYRGIALLSVAYSFCKLYLVKDKNKIRTNNW